MKKIVFATLMCVAAMSAKAQILTSETVKHVYEEVSNQSNSDFVYNVDREDNNINTMYVFKKINKGNEVVGMKPHLKYEYSYAADGTLTSRIAYSWMDSQNKWACASRKSYTLDNNKYQVEYSRYNHKTNSFDEPVEKMIYSLLPNDDINLISCYQRTKPTALFELVSETVVSGLPILFAEK